MSRFYLVWPPPPPQAVFSHEAFGHSPIPVPSQAPGEWICPNQGCIGAVFTFTHGNGPNPSYLSCNICKGGFPYDSATVHELILLNGPDVKYKYCPNACCGHPTRQPKAAMEHPSMAHFSMGTYCRGCGAMWTRKEYIDEPKPKPWLAEVPKMVPIVVPAASAPPLVGEPALEHVQPQPFDHGILPEDVCKHGDLQTQHNMLRVLLSIDRMMKRQEGVLQTIVGQRLARIEDTLDGIGGSAAGIEDMIGAIQDTVQDPQFKQDIKSLRDNMSQVCFILRKAVYKEEGDPYGYDGSLRTFNVNQCEFVDLEDPKPFRIFVISDED